MPEIDHEIKISAPPEQVFAALTTLDGVKGWHNPDAEGTGEVGSEWVFRFTDHPEFGWEVVDIGRAEQGRVAVHPRTRGFRGNHRNLHADEDRRRSHPRRARTRRLAGHTRQLPQVQHDVGRAAAPSARLRRDRRRRTGIRVGDLSCPSRA